jgi:pimeloyl-ACP methyl ester carboxylesterase
MNLKKEAKEIYVESDGVSLHTMIFGSGKPVILLHGFPDFWYGWKDAIMGLRDDFKLIVPDLRGYNLSDKPENLEKYDMEYLINDINAISDNLGMESFYLVGHDWGGVIAWVLTELYPEKVIKLIILNAPHPKIFGKKIQSNEEQRKASSYIFKFLKPKGHEYLIEKNFEALKLAVFSFAKKKYSEDDKKRYLEAWAQPGAIVGGVNYYRANIDFSRFSGKIKVPTLVIHGMKDKAVRPIVLEGLENYVENLTISKIEDASHWVMHDQPELVNSKIKSFIKS